MHGAWARDCGCGGGLFLRRFFSTKEELEGLEEYKTQLKNELSGVEERIQELGNE